MSFSQIQNIPYIPTLLEKVLDLETCCISEESEEEKQHAEVPLPLSLRHTSHDTWMNRTKGPYTTDYSSWNSEKPGIKIRAKPGLNQEWNWTNGGQTIDRVRIKTRLNTGLFS